MRFPFRDASLKRSVARKLLNIFLLKIWLLLGAKGLNSANYQYLLKNKRLLRKKIYWRKLLGGTCPLSRPPVPTALTTKTYIDKNNEWDGYPKRILWYINRRQEILEGMCQCNQFDCSRSDDGEWWWSIEKTHQSLFSLVKYSVCWK